MKALIFNIQKYSIHDGEGIRTTIFFKGCPMTCKWCHNPESQNYQRELMFNEEKCTHCQSCIKICPQSAILIKNTVVTTKRAICNLCETCLDHCINNAREIVGDYYTVDELIEEIDKDYLFYEESHGGVTLSGGEVMTQNMDFVVNLLKKCQRKGYRVNIDTCGYAPYSNFEAILPYVDTFLYDIKHMDETMHLNLTGQPKDLIFSNLSKLNQDKAKINIRIPIIEGINSSDEDAISFVEFLKTINLIQVNLLPYHNIGKSKYSKLDMVYNNNNYSAPTNKRMEEIKNIFEQNNIKTIIGG